MARAGGEPETGAVDPGGGVALLKSFESSSGRACWLPDCLVGVGLSSNFRRADRLRLLMFDVSIINHSILAGTRWITGRDHQTGGNQSDLTGYQSNRSGPVSVWAGTKPNQIQNLNLNSKK